jgi:hypothetical protein
MTTDERVDAIAKQLHELTGVALENEGRAAAALAAASEQHDREMAEIRAALRQAVVLAIRGARQERAKRRELDEKITQIAAAQLASEEKMNQLAAALQRFLERSSNGKP